MEENYPDLSQSPLCPPNHHHTLTFPPHLNSSSPRNLQVTSPPTGSTEPKPCVSDPYFHRKISARRGSCSH
ncbi:uncharacterized protein BO66DRAFT_395364 [Aspergillus aculeatinus CBS 121060]|uniref:Uncharacterized protein n=1 Tax=Aspergillus aculeatinus CBS 121060 TaxID=1448322 RepID=A0ACD1GW50_9EURO|nr:hypothetical protein BO66DRAFT_395364 [Aspergillus aculeatinus CBS 121060]RAH65546.1 hypothetical protein BO66DRAFT_395364 [Aspergillus aculeatinus CBS 121060]